VHVWAKFIILVLDFEATWWGYFWKKRALLLKN